MSKEKFNLLFKIVFIVALSLQISSVKCKKDLKEQCKTCKDIVDAFYKVRNIIIWCEFMITL